MIHELYEWLFLFFNKLFFNPPYTNDIITLTTMFTDITSHITILGYHFIQYLYIYTNINIKMITLQYYFLITYIFESNCCHYYNQATKYRKNNYIDFKMNRYHLFILIVFYFALV